MADARHRQGCRGDSHFRTEWRQSRKDDLDNCWEAGYEKTGELRECLGYDRGYPRAGGELESTGRTDEKDRGMIETARLDTGLRGEPLRCNTAPDQRSAPRPVSRFSLDALVNIATALGCRVRLDFEAA